MAKYTKKNLTVNEKKLTVNREGQAVNRFAVGKFLSDVGINADNFKASMEALTLALKQSMIAMLCPPKGGDYDAALAVTKLLVLLELNGARKAFLSDLVESSDKGFLTYDTFQMLIEFNLENALLDNFEESYLSGEKISTLALKSRHPLLPRYDYFSFNSLLFLVCDTVASHNSARAVRLALKAAEVASRLPISLAPKDKVGNVPTALQWDKFKDNLFNFLKLEEAPDFTILRKSLITFALGCKDWSAL